MTTSITSPTKVTRRSALERAAGAAAVAQALFPRQAPTATREAGGQDGQAAMPPPREPLPNLGAKAVPIPREEYLARQDKARRLMAANNLDGLLLTGGTSLVYFAGFGWGRSERLFAALLPRRGDWIYISPAFERNRAEEQIKFAGDLRVWEEDENPSRLLAQALKDRSVARLGIEERVAYPVSAGLSREAPGVRQSPANAVTEGCRAVKTGRELALMELAGAATVNAIRYAFANMKEGMTQRQVSELVTAAHAQQGVRPGFALVGLGESSAFPHGSRTPRKLREGDIVLIDAGCLVEGYQSDVTRTTVFGPASDRQKQVWDIVKKAQDAALAAARPGATAGSIDDAARRLIEQAGFGPGYKYFTHRLGHGIGMDGHEAPYMVRGNPLRLEAGMTTSDEPGIYIYGEFGVRLEDVMVITETGARFLTLQSQRIAD